MSRRKPFRTLFAASAATLLSLTLTACFAASNAANPAITLSGNWQITSSASTAAQLPRLAGSLTGTAASVHGLFHPANAASCISPETTIAVSGAVDGHNIVTLTSAPFAGGSVLTLTGTLAPGNVLYRATYTVTGGACAFPSPISGDININNNTTANQVAPIAGTYQGTFDDPTGNNIPVTATLTQRALGVLNHLSLGVVDINDAAKKLQEHGWHESKGEHPQDGRDGKRHLNVYDQDLTRVEFMEFQPFSVRAGGEQGIVQAADKLNHFGELVRARGMKFCFHNHNYEFKKLGSTTGFDLLLQHTDPALVGLEMDCYWITQAGRDPIQMLSQHAKRIRLLHLKDRKPGFPPSQDLNADAGHFTEVGSGTIAWPALLKAARQQGIRHFFVEQDASDRTPMESLKISYRYLHGIVA